MYTVAPVGNEEEKEEADGVAEEEKADKEPPIGNDKIIVSSNGKISDEDKKIIFDFFDTMWQFKKIKWIN